MWGSIWNRRERLDRIQGRLSPELIRLWLATQSVFEGRPNLNVRHLTRFSDCPREFWYREILGLSVWPGPLETWPPSSQGDVIHQTLERFLRPMVTREPKDYGSSRLRYIYWEQVHRHFCYKPVGRKPVFDALTMKLESSLMAWIERHRDIGKLHVQAVEWSFGGRQGNDAPPYRIDSPSGPFYLSGRIDRIDWEGGHVVARDYKTNRSAMFSPSAGRKPKEGPRPSWHYPMVLYALVARDHFKAAADAVIEFVDPREGLDRLEVEPGEPTEFSELWENLLGGELTVARDRQHCEGCDYRHMCRPRHEAGMGADEGDETPPPGE
ncbi:MAG: PD-(D/E)XK nuclease family protein [Deltaproteobacteria bacterium]|nr:PD-(D/E)XK nuclease family protein [Deltaproteobacteria bacterium]